VEMPPLRNFERGNIDSLPLRGENVTANKQI
jgi:hypothetical protein